MSAYCVHTSRSIFQRKTRAFQDIEQQSDENSLVCHSRTGTLSCCDEYKELVCCGIHVNDLDGPINKALFAGN